MHENEAIDENEEGVAEPDGPEPAADIAFVVIGDEDRQPVPTIHTSPWQSICALRIVAANGALVKGTGFFVTTQAIVTAAHNVFDHQRGGEAQSIVAIPLLEGASEPYGRPAAASWRFPGSWEGTPTPGTDYAVIRLAVAVPVPGLARAKLANSVVTVTPLVISGYPSDLESATRQYFHSRVAAGATADTLTYEIDTNSGQSGSPILANLPTPTAVGVHVSGTPTANYGVRFTSAALANIANWL